MVCSAEILAVQKDHSLAAGLRRADVHVGHGQGLPLGLELVALNRMRIIEVGEKRIGERRANAGQRECRGDQESDDQHGVESIELFE
jgi:hypothetical protein